MSKNDGGPAFPVPTFREADGRTVLAEHDGLSLRDYFAAAALQGFTANTMMLDWMDRHEGDDPSQRLNIVGSLCYRYADAMLAAREAQ